MVSSMAVGWRGVAWGNSRIEEVGEGHAVTALGNQPLFRLSDIVDHLDVELVAGSWILVVTSEGMPLTPEILLAQKLGLLGHVFKGAALVCGSRHLVKLHTNIT